MTEPRKSQDLRRMARQVGTEHDYKYVESMSETQARAMTAAWTKGASYTDLAEEWNTTIAAARIVVERVLAESLDDFEDRGKQRTRLNMQLNALMRAVSERALNPKDKEQGSFVRLSLLVAERMAALNGLNAPVEHTLLAPQGDDLERWVEAVVRINGSTPPVEGDPFVLEENEDGVFE